MNAFGNSHKNIKHFFSQTVAGVKKGFTFALPITRETLPRNNQL